eukprot:83606_1
MASTEEECFDKYIKTVSGYIHEAEKCLFKDKEYIPIEITQVCILFYVMQRKDTEDRKLRFRLYGLQQSSQPDSVMGYDDNDHVNRANIGCPEQHAITAEVMHLLIKRFMSHGNMNQTNLSCPVCKFELDWHKCAQIADLTEKECRVLKRVIEQRLNFNTKECPYCNTMQSRENDKTFKMSCNSEENKCWCWMCRRPWKTTGIYICGNDNCNLITDVNTMLRNAASVKLGDFIIVPEFRACPKCLCLVQYEKYDKHMRCCSCSCKFCFVCLDMVDERTRQLPCSQYCCKVAPFQSFN